MRLVQAVISAVAVARKAVPEMPSCPNWPEFVCRSQAKVCLWCPESSQCMPAAGQCPLDEAPAPKRLDCHKVTGPASCVLNRDMKTACRGFCLRYKTDADNNVSLLWDDGLCLNGFEICPETTRKMVTSITEVPCAVRSTCHECYQNTWGKEVEDEPSCVWTAEKCQDRADETDEEYHIGVCPSVWED
ncbi:hypothetical protein GNI_102030 [Gregarina niphandrodes]|uniref:Uncharacterized protein n=1 Tax=Gregarina niphandrodes TaxID=110365 RepID=A0A023B4Q8_GRENI|nr:hypothetical protein GNI_102030 [Gregarina niphandrodes]EZG56688.1 hypothetical protein GNI_102030 [Gregarina niphandrodes]|eukprot:XP_011131202.1 hypothetical protein GNI_102030 [Gregarina niphandrodes]